MASLTDCLATDLMYLSMGAKAINPKRRKERAWVELRAKHVLVPVTRGKKIQFASVSKTKLRGQTALSLKMELARIGLGLKELSFDGDGDALHIHSVLLTAFKQLDACGGYTLLRLATNSTDLIEIQPPKGCMTVRYLKYIVKSAKLYVRPLQAHIDCDEDSQPEVLSTSARYHISGQGVIDSQIGERACNIDSKREYPIH